MSNFTLGARLFSRFLGVGDGTFSIWEGNKGGRPAAIKRMGEPCMVRPSKNGS